MRYDPWPYVPPVVLSVLGAAVLLRLIDAREHSYSREHVRKGVTLIEEATRWHATAAQDGDPAHAARHADLALAYLNAAREVLPDGVLEKAARVDVHALHDLLERETRARAAALAQACAACAGGGAAADPPPPAARHASAGGGGAGAAAAAEGGRRVSWMRV